MKSKFLLLPFLMAIVLMTACNREAKSDDSAATTSPKEKVVVNNSNANNNAQANRPANTTANRAQANKTATDKNSLVKWVSINELEEVSKKEKRKVMVDLYTGWCGWCKKMDKATFQHPDIAKVLNEKFYAVKFNAEDKNNINFKGKDHPFVGQGRRGYNQLAHNFANGRMSYPTIAFLDEDLNRINSFPGFKQPHQFDPLLSFISGDHYKKTSLREYQQGYKSSIAAPPAPPAKKGGNPNIQVKKNQPTIQVKKQ